MNMECYDFEYPLTSRPEGWSEQTVYEFAGPTTDGMEHSLIIDGTRGVTFSCRYAGKPFKVVFSELQELVSKLISRS